MKTHHVASFEKRWSHEPNLRRAKDDWRDPVKPVYMYPPRSGASSRNDFRYLQDTTLGVSFDRLPPGATTAARPPFRTGRIGAVHEPDVVRGTGPAGALNVGKSTYRPTSAATRALRSVASARGANGTMYDGGADATGGGYYAVSPSGPHRDTMGPSVQPLGVQAEFASYPEHSRERMYTETVRERRNEHLRTGRVAPEWERQRMVMDVVGAKSAQQLVDGGHDTRYRHPGTLLDQRRSRQTIDSRERLRQAYDGSLTRPATASASSAPAVGRLRPQSAARAGRPAVPRYGGSGEAEGYPMANPSYGGDAAAYGGEGPDARPLPSTAIDGFTDDRAAKFVDDRTTDNASFAHTIEPWPLGDALSPGRYVRPAMLDSTAGRHLQTPYGDRDEAGDYSYAHGPALSDTVIPTTAAERQGLYDPPRRVGSVLDDFRDIEGRFGARSPMHDRGEPNVYGYGPASRHDASGWRGDATASGTGAGTSTRWVIGERGPVGISALGTTDPSYVAAAGLGYRSDGPAPTALGRTVLHSTLPSLPSQHAPPQHATGPSANPIIHCNEGHFYMSPGGHVAQHPTGRTVYARATADQLGAGGASVYAPVPYPHYDSSAYGGSVFGANVDASHAPPLMTAAHQSSHLSPPRPLYSSLRTAY